MIGYDAIEPRAPSLAVGVPPEFPERKFLRGVRVQMAAQGFTEVYNYSFIGEDDACAFGFDPSDHVAVANPIASDQTLMQTVHRPMPAPGVRTSGNWRTAISR